MPFRILDSGFNPLCRDPASRKQFIGASGDEKASWLKSSRDYYCDVDWRADSWYNRINLSHSGGNSGQRHSERFYQKIRFA